MDNIYQSLLDDYIKVLCIDSKMGTFKPIKVLEGENVSYSGINQWFIQFALSDALPNEYKKEFLEFANLGSIKDQLKRNNSTSFIYPRRFPNNEIRWMKMKCCYVQDEEILLTIRDITVQQKTKHEFNKEELVKQIKECEESHASIALAIIEFSEENFVSVYEILRKNYESCYEYVKYDDNHYLIYTFDKSKREVFPLLAQLYKNFEDIEVSIGGVWSDDNWNLLDLIEQAITNLQINKE